jgi:5-methylcytosine-specific restriction protein A
MTKRSADPSDWYRTYRWQRRAKAQLVEQPLCVFHLEKGVVVPGVVADHITPHKGDWNAFWLSPLQTLCLNCHVSGKKYLENRGFRSDIGEDGLPVDQKHPFWGRGTGVG